MTAAPISRTQNTFAPPVMEARRWVAGKAFTNPPLLNVSQAAPVDPPPAPLLDAMQGFLGQADTHLYGPVLGLPALRDEVAQQWTAAYGGAVTAAQVAITSGCNQAFTAAISTLCSEGDSVIVPVPFYFNHKMWLDMAGVTMTALPCGAGMVPSADAAADLITDKTRAIVLVTPNNPCGVEYPADVLDAFYDLATAKGLALIVDETYRDFHSQSGAAHGLFQRVGWDDTLIQLYSFSKAYRLTGHRVGAAVASTGRLSEMEKFLDTVAICPNQLGQKAALWGMQNLRGWLAGERVEILDRRAAITEHFPILEAKGWRLLGVGAYFAYVQHPFDLPSDHVSKALVDAAAVLTLPGTMFTPDGDASGKHQIRIAFANINRAEIRELFMRLSAVSL